MFTISNGAASGNHRQPSKQQRNRLADIIAVATPCPADTNLFMTLAAHQTINPGKQRGRKGEERKWAIGLDGNGQWHRPSGQPTKPAPLARSQLAVTPAYPSRQKEKWNGSNNRGDGLTRTSSTHFSNPTTPLPLPPLARSYLLCPDFTHLLLPQRHLLSRTFICAIHANSHPINLCLSAR